jgi:hypothetical protein
MKLQLCLTITNKALNFESDLKEYEMDQFFEDLALVLHLDGYKEAELKYIYSQVILLSYGLWTTKFVDDLVNESDKEDDTYFGSLLNSILAFYKGDIKNLKKYFPFLEKVWSFKQIKRQFPYNQMMTILLLCKGRKIIDKVSDKHMISRQYRNLFKTLFLNKGFKVMYFHRLLTMPKLALKAMLDKHEVCEYNSPGELQIIKKLLEQQKSSSDKVDYAFKWFRSLLQITLNDLRGFDLIAEWENINSSHKIDLYRWVLSRSTNKLEYLFKSLKHSQMPFLLSQLLVRSLNEDEKATFEHIEEFVALLINKKNKKNLIKEIHTIETYKQDQEILKIFHSFEKLMSNMNKLMEMSNGISLPVESMGELFNDLGFEFKFSQIYWILTSLYEQDLPNLIQSLKVFQTDELQDIIKDEFFSTCDNFIHLKKCNINSDDIVSMIEYFPNFGHDEIESFK